MIRTDYGAAGLYRQPLVNSEFCTLGQAECEVQTCLESLVAVVSTR